MKALPWHALALVALVAGCTSSASPGTAAPSTPSSPVPSSATTDRPTVATASSTVAPGSAPPSTPATPPDLGRLVGMVPTGRVLVEIEQGGHGTIAVVALDHDGMHAVAAVTDDTMANAAWLARAAIVYDVATGDHRHLFRMDLNSEHVEGLTHDPATGEEKAAVSADGSTIAYEHYAVGSNQDLGVQVASPVDAAPHGLAPYADPINGGDTEVALSPDGRWLAFIRVPDWDAPGAGLFVVPATGGKPKRLTPDAMDAGYPRWSPDGRSILFTQGYHSKGSTGPLWVVAADSGDPHPLAALGGPGWAFEGDWSPNGSEIVFKYYEQGWDHNELHIATTVGADEQTVWIGSHSMTAETPDWGP
jgi:Tol biopolymer transport system component